MNDNNNVKQEAKNQEQETKNSSTNVVLALIGKDIDYIKNDMTEIKDLIKNQYVLKSDFDPIKKIVYGTVAIILTSVIGALIYLVLK